jgi:bacterioferritin (cytochrome b1)
MAQSRKNMPSRVETQFLLDMRTITGRISELILSDGKGRGGHQRTLTALLQLALSMESTFAVWCWRHVHLERVSSDVAARGTLKRRAEAAMADADRIAERLNEITGTTEFHVDWLPSASEPIVADRWTFTSAVNDEIAADQIILDCYARLIEYVRRHDASTAAVLETIARARRRRIRTDLARAS